MPFVAVQAGLVSRSSPTSSQLFLSRRFSSSALNMASTTTAWKEMPEIPTAEELLSPHNSALPQILEHGAMTKEEYLEAQYLLHRHEATASLRAAVQQIRHGDLALGSEDANIYTKVRVLGFRPTKSGVAWRIVWKPNSPGHLMSISQPDCLPSGTLVILSPKADSFRTQCLVATVAQKHPDEVQTARESSSCEIIWARCEDAILDPDVELIMLEPESGYFEPSRHIMKGLKLAASASSRYDKYLFKTKNGASEKNEPVTFDEPVKSHVSADFLRLASKREPVASPAAVQLDSSQLEAVQQATKQELAMIQGPPGTGKTFTSVVTIDSHLRTMEACHPTNDAPPPIIVVAETNHALDQLLTQCMSAGLRSILRLGHNVQEDSVIYNKSLLKLLMRSRVKLPEKKADAKYKQAVKVLTSDLNQVFMDKAFYEAQALHDAELISPKQYLSLIEDDGWETADAQDKRGPVAKWLNHSSVQSQCDPQQPVNNTIPHEGVFPNYIPFGVSTARGLLRSVERDGINDWAIRAVRLLECSSDLYQIPLWQRRHIYCLLHKQMQERSIQNLLQAIKVFDIECEDFKKARSVNDAAVIRGEDIRIIGCTTTGLAKYRRLLEILKPRILLVEEAAEVREGSIVAGLMPCIEQLVLVGDHQQLIPSVDVWELSRSPHRIDISLFERMVKLEVPFCSLRVQRRMAPALRRVMQSFYPHIQDHASVKELPLVPGMSSRRLWWFDHQWEQSQTVGCSFVNTEEADMIVGFVGYLIQHGMSPSRITVLAYYSGQVALIQRKLKSHPNLARFDFERSVRTIDGFQGEENDVILLSLLWQ
ncbi:hypothetical protein CDD81_4715 [Ophiocordyceps australis]|uniref:Helicase ATP-binding domain-containing protein n=1 Tax=Ophiocordyceps australis TaxID=1399860 RepID=A0A2C5XIZ5_9HYPO|nr:hypothetical protein CDD81_4715 [Ophiocordyceps australis]